VGKESVMLFPKLGSDEYIKARTRGKLLVDLGEVIIKQYGEKDSIALLQKFNEAEKAKETK
jgi:hypothetical protein